MSVGIATLGMYNQLLVKIINRNSSSFTGPGSAAETNYIPVFEPLPEVRVDGVEIDDDIEKISISNPEENGNGN